jgi:hypothetical protein
MKPKMLEITELEDELSRHVSSQESLSLESATQSNNIDGAMSFKSGKFGDIS